jgi:hypothetical protein
VGKKIAFRAAAIALSLVAALVLFEIFLRIFHIKPLRYSPEQVLAWDGATFRQAENNWGEGLIKTNSRFASEGVDMGEYVPHAAFKLVFADNPRGYFDGSNGVVMTLNSLGLRGAEVPAEKPAGTYRILGIGDSFAFGEGVKDEDTFFARLQARLNAGAAASRFQVLNAGVQGYNTRDEVLYLERRWLVLDPDLVLIVFYINDAYNDNTIINRGQELGIYNAQPAGLAAHFYLWDMVQHRYATHQMAKAVETFYRNQYFSDAGTVLENPGPYKVDWPVCAKALAHAAELSRTRKFKLGLVIFPELYRLNGNYPFGSIHKLVGDTCQRLNIPFLDLFPTFRGHDAESLWVHPSNHHPNEVAHALAETAVEQFVREKFLPTVPP